MAIKATTQCQTYWPFSSGSLSVTPPVANLQTSTAAFNTLQRRGGGEQLSSSALTECAITEARKENKNQATVTLDDYPQPLQIA